jgi:hypothetical protein
MDNVVIVKMGFEGGGVTIYGRQTDGVWSLWNEGVSMYFDENDEENWRCWSSDPVSELSELLPKEWWQMSPTKVHPEFVAPLRREYERFRSAGGEIWSPFSHERWQRLFTGAGRHAEPRPAADGVDR